MSQNNPKHSSVTQELERVQLEDRNGVPMQHGCRTRDITDDFIYTAKALGVGQLVKDASFTLFDSVQALEIMDPKMDTGCLNSGESLDDDFEVDRDLLPEEIVWIMDEILCYQMAWHEGYALAQNILTSLHIDNLLSQKRSKGSSPLFKALNESQRQPNQITQVVLRTFCIGVVKSCDIAMEIVQSQQYYEEEDFSTYNFDKDLLTDISDDKYLGLVQTAQDWVKTQLKQASLGIEICSALVARLTLNPRLLSVVLPIGDKLVPTELWGNDFDDVLATVKDTHKLAKPVEHAFSHKLQRRLASNIPPRPINTLSFDKACATIQKMQQDLVEAAAVDSFEKGTSLQRLEAFLQSFASREPLPLPRAVAQMFLFGEGRVAATGRDEIRSSFWQELQDHLPEGRQLSTNIFDAEAPHDEGFQCAEVFVQWSQEAQGVYITVLHSLCQNPCRIRRCLSNAVTDIDVLFSKLVRKFFDSPSQYESFPRSLVARKDDSRMLASDVKWLACWIVEQFRLRVIRAVLTTGFEQDIYLTNELPKLYALNHRIVLDSIKAIEASMFITDPATGPRTSRQGFDIADNVAKVRSRLIVTRVENSMLESVAAVYAALVRLDALQLPPTPYCTAAAQSEVRLGAFASTRTQTPALRIPGRSITDIDPSQDVHMLLMGAANSITSAKTTIMPLITNPVKFNAWLNRADLATTLAAAAYAREQIKDMARACFALGKLLDVLQRALETHGGEKALKGKLALVMPEKHLGRWILPSEIRVYN